MSQILTPVRTRGSRAYNTPKKPAAQFKAARGHMRFHLNAAIEAFLPLPTLPPEFWGWAERILWRDYTPDQRSVLTAVGYVAHLRADTFTDHPTTLRMGPLGQEIRIRVPLPPLPAPTLPLPLFTAAGRRDLAQRTLGSYLPLLGPNQLWETISAELMHYTQLAHRVGIEAHLGPDHRGQQPPPPALQPWLAALYETHEQAVTYGTALWLVLTLWDLLQREQADAEDEDLPLRPTFVDSCRSCLLVAPEWLPSDKVPVRRRSLPAVTRTRIEHRMEQHLRTAMDGANASPGTHPHVYNKDITAIIPAPHAPLLPQLRAFLLPALTAYRLSGNRA